MLIERLGEIRSGELSVEELAGLISTAPSLLAFRYLAAPPISSDDLSTLVDRKITDAVWRRPEDVALVRDMIFAILDPFRFPWIAEQRPAKPEEIEAAVLASAGLLAAQQVHTRRRTQSTKAQELAVREVFAQAGFEETPRRRVDHLSDAPTPGEFCGESILGGTRADIIATLHDRRILAIECKASNSSVNSFKRLIHESLGKAHKWRPKFGEAHLISAVVLGGVFSPANLLMAQDGGLAIFWQFRINDLREFIVGARL